MSIYIRRCRRTTYSTALVQRLQTFADGHLVTIEQLVDVQSYIKRNQRTKSSFLQSCSLLLSWNVQNIKWTLKHHTLEFKNDNKLNVSRKAFSQLSTKWLQPAAAQTYHSRSADSIDVRRD